MHGLSLEMLPDRNPLRLKDTAGVKGHKVMCLRAILLVGISPIESDALELRLLVHRNHQFLHGLHMFLVYLHTALQQSH